MNCINTDKNVINMCVTMRHETGRIYLGGRPPIGGENKM